MIRPRSAAAALGRAILLVLPSLCACHGGPGPRTAASVATESTTVGAPAPDFTLRDLDGRNETLSDRLGKDVVLLDFWATWCVPCGAEMPHLDQLYRAHKDQGFVVFGISMDGPESVAQVGPYARRYGISFPVLLDEETRAVAVYNPKRIAPLSVLIDRKGQIVRIRNGYNAGDETLLEADVAQLLAGKAP